MSATDTGAQPGQAARRLLDHIVVDAVQQTGAHAAGLWVLPPGEDVLVLESVVGMPPEFSRPWHRVRLTYSLPVTDAVAARALVEVNTQQELCRRYPRAALVLPYSFALAAAPLIDDGEVLGALLLVWPGSRQRPLSPPVRDRLREACVLLASTLHCAHRANGFTLSAEPRALHSLTPAAAADEDGTAAAVVRRLPEGYLALDLHGHIAFVTATAAELLGCAPSELTGSLPWESVRWLDDPVYEDRYRTAVISRQATEFTARRPDGRWFGFHLYPDDTCITVRVVPREPPGTRSRRVTVPGAAASTRVGFLYHLMHLAGALTEAISVQDVVRLVADTVLPAFEAQGMVMLVADGGRLRVVGHRGYPVATMEYFDGTPLTSPTPGVRALTKGETGFFESREELEAAYPARVGRADGMAAWAFLPLIASGRPVGTCVLAYDRPHPFTAEERASLTSLSGLIAQALDRSRVYDAEHALAQSLQRGLVRCLHRSPALRRPGQGDAQYPSWSVKAIPPPTGWEPSGGCVCRAPPSGSR